MKFSNHTMQPAKSFAVLHLFQKPLRLQWQIHSSSHGPQFWEAYKGSQGSKCLMTFLYYQFHIKIKIGFFLGSRPRNQNPITDNYCISWYVTPLNQQFRRGQVLFIKKRLLRRAFSFASPWFHHHGSKAKLLGSHCRILSGSVTVGLEPNRRSTSYAHFVKNQKLGT